MKYTWLALPALGLLIYSFSSRMRDSGSEAAIAPDARSTMRSVFQEVVSAEEQVLPVRLYFDEAERPAEASELVDELNSPETDASSDVRLVKAVFSHYRTAFQKNPVGVHEEIVSALTGGNAQKIAYIPTSHPALANGQLHDRWGTPFYFHQLDGEVMEVRSAGPDNRHWTEDDVTTQ